MQEVSVQSWEAFQRALEDLLAEHARRREDGGAVSELLFRGHANCDWPVTTTLERVSRKLPVVEYYRMIRIAQPEVETFTGKRWSIPEPEDVEKDLQERDRLVPLPAYDHMVYLRHHGFPSPLLDWTRSPYIAAYFAFRVEQDCEQASIHIYCERYGSGKVRDPAAPHLYALGPHVRGDKRHFLQQSEYTVCAARDAKLGWCFVPHWEVFSNAQPEQDLLWKFNIPVRERARILRKLDAVNINAFSLFGSEESLIETIAARYVLPGAP